MRPADPVPPRPVARARLERLLGSFGRKRILVVGDLMLDQYIRGRVRRISPEAPVPVVEVASEAYVPGGAGNVCANLAALGASVSAVSVIGDDEAGRVLAAALKGEGIGLSGVAVDPERPTPQKCRVIADHQQVVRFDREHNRHPGARTLARIIEAAAAAAASSDAVVLSDYGKGVLCPKVLKAVIRAGRAAGVPVTVDPKVEHFRLYRDVDCVTPNLQEAFAGMRQLQRDGDAAVEGLGRRILAALRCASVLITRGERGMTLCERAGGGRPARVAHIPAVAREVFDVTGAGDTVISVLTLALASGASPLEAAAISNMAAGIVVGKLGTATVTVAELGGARAG